MGARTVRAASLALVAGLLSGCGGGGSSPAPVGAPARQQQELTIGGQKRSYRVFAPPSLDRARAPALVLVLGGYGNTKESMVETTQFDRQAIDGGFVVAYPEGRDLTWNAGYCCGTAARDGVDDVVFLTSVMDQVQADYGTDRARVFVAGVSNGGMMAYRLACQAADRVAGVGSMAGAMIVDDCHPSRPVAVIEIHGTADPLVPYEGGPTVGGATQPSPSSMAVAQRWAELDRCPGGPATTPKPPVTTATWTGCAPGTAVRLVTVEGGGHTWFAPGFGPANGAVDATAQMWTFFSGLGPRS